MVDKSAETREGQTELDQIKADASTVDPTKVTEEKETKDKEQKEELYPKSYVDAEKSKVQSTFEKKQRAAERKAEELGTEVTGLKSTLAKLQERLNLAERERDRVIEDQLGQTPEGQQLLLVRKELQQKMKDLDARELEVNQKYELGTRGLKVADALGLAKEHEIEDYTVLLDAGSYHEMETKALKLKNEKLLAELAGKQTKAKATDSKKDGKEESGESEDTDLHIDSGANSTAAPNKLKDDDFIKLYGEGKLIGTQYDKRAKQILDKLTKGG